MAQRFSLLRFLSNDEELYALGFQAELRSRFHRKSSQLELLPPELRDKIFQHCIFDYQAAPFATTVPTRPFETTHTPALYKTLLATTILSTTCLLAALILLLWPCERSTVLLQWCGLLSLPALYTTVQASVLLRQRWAQNSSEKVPRTNIWQELVAGAVLLEDLLVPYEPPAIRQDGRANEKLPDGLYDLPIFFLNRGLRDEALGTATRYGCNPPPCRSRRLIGICPYFNYPKFSTARGCMASDRREVDYCDACRLRAARIRSRQESRIRYATYRTGILTDHQNVWDRWDAAVLRSIRER